MGGDGRDSAGGGRHSPGEFGSCPVALRSIKQPLLRPGFRLAGAGLFMGGNGRDSPDWAALSGGIRLLSGGSLHNKTAPAPSGFPAGRGLWCLWGLAGRALPGDGRRSPGEFGSSPAVPCTTKQPLHRPGFRLGGGCFQFRGGFTRASCPVYCCMRSNGGRGTGA